MSVSSCLAVMVVRGRLLGWSPSNEPSETSPPATLSAVRIATRSIRLPKRGVESCDYKVINCGRPEVALRRARPKFPRRRPPNVCSAMFALPQLEFISPQRANRRFADRRLIVLIKAHLSLSVFAPPYTCQLFLSSLCQLCVGNRSQ